MVYAMYQMNISNKNGKKIIKFGNLNKLITIYILFMFIISVFSFIPVFIADETLLVDSEFNDSTDSNDLRNNSIGQDWYESGNNTPTLLTLDISDINDNSGNKTILSNYGIESSIYLTQEFNSSQNGNFSVSFDINIDRIENNSPIDVFSLGIINHQV